MRHRWSSKVKVGKRSWIQTCLNCGMTKEPHYPMGTIYSHGNLKDGFDFIAGVCPPIHSKRKPTP